MLQNLSIEFLIELKNNRFTMIKSVSMLKMMKEIKMSEQQLEYEEINRILLRSLSGYTSNDFFNLASQNLYHYTKLDSFWKIITTDSIRISNIGFSNDYNEIVSGIEFLDELAKSNAYETIDMDILQTDDGKRKNVSVCDLYFMCLSSEKDMRSQWSEYCWGGMGVSIGFDFTTSNCYLREEDLVNDELKNAQKFTFIHKDSLEESEEEMILKKGLPYITTPISVLYVNKDEEEKRTIPEAYEEVVKDISKFCDLLLEKYDKESPFNYKLERYLIPLLKDPAFVEENEYRMLFFTNAYDDLSNCYHSGIKTINDYLHYNGDNYSPGIIMKYCHERGYPEFKDLNYILIKNKDSDEITFYKLPKYSKLSEIAYTLKKRGLDYSDFESVIIPQCKMEDQREVFAQLDWFFNDTVYESPKVKIWCEGHLPIRELIVKQGEKDDIIIKTIKHYCGTKYWMKHVDIRKSDIPYRERI